MKICKRCRNEYLPGAGCPCRKAKENAARPSGAASCSASDTIALVRQHNRWRRGDESLGMEHTKVIGEALDAICDLAEKLESERNTARVVAADAIRELDRILDTGDTYASQEIVQNLKCFLRGDSYEKNLNKPKQ